MNFRFATDEDLEVMATESINQTCDRKLEETVDYMYALEDNGRLLGCGGFRMIIPTCCWTWVDLTEYGVENILTSYRVIRECMEGYTKDGVFHEGFVQKNGITRVQAFVRNGDKEIRLVEHLGFERESVMEKFYGTDDAFLYRKLF